MTLLSGMGWDSTNLRVSVRRSDNLEATKSQISALPFTQRRTRERNSCLHLVHNVLLK
jgi:hypothetical protein